MWNTLFESVDSATFTELQNHSAELWRTIYLD